MGDDIHHISHVSLLRHLKDKETNYSNIICVLRGFKSDDEASLLGPTMTLNYF